MAKRKKGSSRRRKVGAAALNPGSPIVQLGSVAVGYLLADTINAPIDKMIKGSAATVPEKTNKLVGAGEAGLGALLVLGKGKKSLVKTVAGGVLAGAGLKRLLKAFGVMSGYQAVPVIGRRRMSGYQAVPVIGSTSDGINGYRVNGNPAVGGYTVNSAGPKVMGNASGSGLVHESGSSLMN